MRAIAVSLLVLFALPVMGHDVVLPVLIDTDAAPDDLRAICLLLAMDEVHVIGITVSDGACAPSAGLAKVRALLGELGIDYIPTALGPALESDPPPWRSFCESVRWGEKADGSGEPGQAAAELIAGLLRSAERPALVVCLGSLTNVASALRADPGIADKIERILWYNDRVDPPSGSNYERDPVAADFVLAAGLRVDVFSYVGMNAVPFDVSLLDGISGIGTSYADAIVASHSRPEVMDRVRNGHLKIWDELLPLWIRDAEAFRLQRLSSESGIGIRSVTDEQALRKTYLEILTGESERHGGSVIFAQFPSSPVSYSADLRPYVERIIERHGEDEWRICVLTNELHRHLGIYSIVGAKMGLRAREILGVGIDVLEVVSHAGSRPPVSCLNDGLQASTGATVGHGTLTLEKGEKAMPEAVFSTGERKVKLRIKEEYLHRVRVDIKKAIDELGNLTPAYWRRVRRLAIGYWLEWDRKELFEVTEIEGH